MASKEYLNFFRKEKSFDNLRKEFGNDTAVNIFSELLQEEFIKETKKRHYKLTETGEKNLNRILEEDKKNKKSPLLKHPLFIILILVILTAFSTYLITIHFMNLENELSVRFIGENEIMVAQNQTIPFNGIMIYNPTGKKVSLKNLYLERPINWIKYQSDSINQKVTKGSSEVTYTVPNLIDEYNPYMILESGDTKLMSGQFNLIAPYKEGIYKLNFYTETLDGKKYYIDKKLIIEVKLK